MFRLLPETPTDRDEVEALFDLAFSPGRTALSSYRLRDGVAPLDALAGAVRFWPVRVGAGSLPAALLGPIAVHPTRQGEGLGALLMSEGLGRAAATGWTRILLVGDAPYYGRFGFRRVPVEFPPPTNPDRVLGLGLATGAAEELWGAVTPWPSGCRAVAGWPP